MKSNIYKLFVMNQIILFIKGVYVKYIGDSHYKKNVLTMVGGRIIAQAIPILLTPLFTRIYSPGEFGVFAVYSSIVSLVALISNGRYCLSIILPKEKAKAQSMVLLSSLLTIVVSILFLTILIFFRKEIFNSLNLNSISDYSLLLVLNIIFLGLYEAIYYYALREKKFRVLATNLIVQSSILIVIRLVAGYFGFTNIGLILSYLVSYIVSYMLLLFKSGLPNVMSLLKQNFKILLKEYSNFPRFSLFSDILGFLSVNFPNILLNKAYGSSSAGYFSLSDKVLGTPLWFVTSSVGDVFKQEASEQYRNGGSCKAIFEKTTKSLILIGIIPFLLIFTVVPYLIPFIFGEIWSPAGEYIRIFSLMYFSNFVVNPTAHIVYIVNKQKYAVLFQVVKVISLVLAFIIGFYNNSLTLGLIFWSVLMTLSNVLIFIISYKFARESKYVEPVKENIL